MLPADTKEKINEFFYEKEALWALFSFGAKFRQNEKHRNKMVPVAWKNKLKFFWATFEPCFQLVAVFECSEKFKKTCRHLMLNPSCDANPMAQHLKFEKNHQFGGFGALHSHFFLNLIMYLCVCAFHKVPNYVNPKGFWDRYLWNSSVIPKKQVESLIYTWFIENLGCLDGLTPWIHKYTTGRGKNRNRKKVFGWFWQLWEEPLFIMQCKLKLDIY